MIPKVNEVKNNLIAAKDLMTILQVASTSQQTTPYTTQMHFIGQLMQNAIDHLNIKEEEPKEVIEEVNEAVD